VNLPHLKNNSNNQQMKRALAISNILSWINLVIGCILMCFALLMLISMPMLPVLISGVLIGCIVLHSYAALQLRKSISNPSIPLNKQTPVGIRMMGFMSLFFATMALMSAVFTLQNIDDLLKQAQVPKEMNKSLMHKALLISSVFSLIFSLCVIVNVGLNFRLLSWYKLLQSNNNIQ
jgi:hypothetical protein